MTKETLLVVEDNRDIREGLHEMLTLEGFLVMTAGNGREALQKMSTILPDLILSDIAMPEMDGFAFFAAVHGRSDWLAVPFIFLTASGDPKDQIAGKRLGVDDYLVKPVCREELVAAVRARLKRSREIQVTQLKQAYRASLSALANAIDLRDPYTRGHVERVTDYALEIAVQLGWGERPLEDLQFGTTLHDIGKIHIREGTLYKQVALTDEEWSEIRIHPVAGADMIKEIPYLEGAAPVIRHHHERWDGKGYPDGLRGEAIPPGARIAAVADSFDAMTSNRPYSPARSPEEACAEIVCCSGLQYDPAVVEAFLRAWNVGRIQAVHDRKDSTLM